MEAISTPSVPASRGPLSQGIIAGDYLFLSGQTGVNPEDGKLCGSTIDSQAEQIMLNLKVILENQGITFNNVIKTTCFLTDMSNFKMFNEVYAKYFIGKPARSCFAVKELPRGALCEVELIAYMK